MRNVLECIFYATWVYFNLVSKVFLARGVRRRVLFINSGARQVWLYFLATRDYKISDLWDKSMVC